MRRINERLEEIRNLLIWDLWQQKVTVADIAQIFDSTTSQIYNIIKEMKGT